MMNKVIDFLKENPVQYLATVGRDGKAKCRWREHTCYHQIPVLENDGGESGCNLCLSESRRSLCAGEYPQAFDLY